MPRFDRSAIEELFDYTGWVWGQVARTIAESGGEALLVRAAPGSGWPALRNCLGHIHFGYDRWMGFLKGEKRPAFDGGGVTTWAEIEDYRNFAREDFRAFLEAQTDEELYRVREITIDGDAAPYSYGELLAHLLLHERGHHGDVSTLFYQLDIEIPQLDYRFHLGRVPD